MKKSRLCSFLVAGLLLLTLLAGPMTGGLTALADGPVVGTSYDFFSEVNPPDASSVMMKEGALWKSYGLSSLNEPLPSVYRFVPASSAWGNVYSGNDHQPDNTTLIYGGGVLVPSTVRDTVFEFRVPKAGTVNAMLTTLIRSDSQPASVRFGIYKNTLADAGRISGSSDTAVDKGQTAALTAYDIAVEEGDRIYMVVRNPALWTALVDSVFKVTYTAIRSVDTATDNGIAAGDYVSLNESTGQASVFQRYALVDGVLTPLVFHNQNNDARYILDNPGNNGNQHLHLTYHTLHSGADEIVIEYTAPANGTVRLDTVIAMMVDSSRPSMDGVRVRYYKDSLDASAQIGAAMVNNMTAPQTKSDAIEVLAGDKLYITIDKVDNQDTDSAYYALRATYTRAGLGEYQFFEDVNPTGTGGTTLLTAGSRWSTYTINHLGARLPSSFHVSGGGWVNAYPGAGEPNAGYILYDGATVVPASSHDTVYEFRVPEAGTVDIAYGATVRLAGTSVSGVTFNLYKNSIGQNGLLDSQTVAPGGTADLSAASLAVQEGDRLYLVIRQINGWTALDGCSLQVAYTAYDAQKTATDNGVAAGDYYSANAAVLSQQTGAFKFYAAGAQGMTPLVWNSSEARLCLPDGSNGNEHMRVGCQTFHPGTDATIVEFTAPANGAIAFDCALAMVSQPNPADPGQDGVRLNVYLDEIGENGKLGFALVSQSAATSSKEGSVTVTRGQRLLFVLDKNQYLNTDSAYWAIALRYTEVGLPAYRFYDDFNSPAAGAAMLTGGSPWKAFVADPDSGAFYPSVFTPYPGGGAWVNQYAGDNQGLPWAGFLIYDGGTLVLATGTKTIFEFRAPRSGTVDVSFDFTREGRGGSHSLSVGIYKNGLESSDRISGTASTVAAPESAASLNACGVTVASGDRIYMVFDGVTAWTAVDGAAFTVDYQTESAATDQTHNGVSAGDGFSMNASIDGTQGNGGYTFYARQNGALIPLTWDNQNRYILAGGSGGNEHLTVSCRKLMPGNDDLVIAFTAPATGRVAFDLALRTEVPSGTAPRDGVTVNLYKNALTGEQAMSPLSVTGTAYTACTTEADVEAGDVYYLVINKNVWLDSDDLLYNINVRYLELGNFVEVDVQTPSSGLVVVDAAQFGMSTASADNSAALRAALAHCAANPGTKLVIPQGRYLFDNPDKIVGSHLKNVVIDGQGSEFIFRDIGFFSFDSCEVVEVKNLIVDWDWSLSRPANLVRVHAKGSNYVDFLFTEVDSIRPDDVVFTTMNQFDPVTLTPGCEDGKEWHGGTDPSSMVNVAPNILRAYDMSNQGQLNIGEYYLVRNYAYRSHAFEFNNDRHVSVSNITIYSAPGMGFVVSSGTSHIQFDGCVIGLRPGEESNRRLSTSADGLHCLNTGGYIRVENCDFSFMGDDGVNIHDNVGVVSQQLSANTLKIVPTLLSAPGDTISFINSDFSPTDFTARLISVYYASDMDIILEFDCAIPGQYAAAGMILRNTKWDSRNFIIRNNYFHENRARGILAQGGNGIIEGNVFYRTQGAAILVINDIYPGLWSEGTGVDNLTIRRNSFTMCNVNDWTALIDIHSSINGTVTSYPMFTNIKIDSNEFTDLPSLWLRIASANNVTVSNNTVSNPTTFGSNKATRGRVSIEKSSNVRVICNQFNQSPYMGSAVMSWIDGGGTYGIVWQNNTLK